MEQNPFEVALYLVSESVKARVNSDNTTALIVALNAGVEPSLVDQAKEDEPQVDSSLEDPFARFPDRGN